MRVALVNMMKKKTLCQSMKIVPYRKNEEMSINHDMSCKKRYHNLY